MYIVRWLGHNGNSLYGFMGLQSKMLEWVSGVGEWSGWIPLRLLRLLEHLRCEKHRSQQTNIFLTHI